MVDRAPTDVEVGRIVFISWEHRWITGEQESPSIAKAKRVLPVDPISPIYAILQDWEDELVKSSLPFSPYGLRIRPAGINWIEVTESQDVFVRHCRRSMNLGDICPSWDDILPIPMTKAGKYGATIFAPRGDQPITHGYSLEWRAAPYPAVVDIDKLMRKYSRRYEEPSAFPPVR